jgi:alkylation response protein AidB-like acyl-CoA dehydrogenase
MTVQTYAVESLLYRTAGLIDASIARGGGMNAVLMAMEEFAVEASIAKVSGSEALDFVLDENIQIHGGNGFVKDYPAERHFRDARVNRIFEGTNEINRLLIPGMLIRRAMKGDLPLIAAARRLQDEILTGARGFEGRSDNDLDDQKRSVEAFKKIALMTLGLAMQRYGKDITEEQEVLLCIADIVIAAACGESAVLRAESAPDDMAPLHVDAASTFVNDASLRVEASAKQVLAAMSEGDTLRTHLAALRRLLKVAPIDTVVRRRRLADETVRRGNYIFQ